MKKKMIALFMAAMCCSVAGCMEKETPIENGNMGEQETDVSEDAEITPTENPVKTPTEEPTPEPTQVVKDDDVEKQLQLLADNSSQWELEDAMYGSCGYAVTDLNQNGRLEILASVCQGTGFFSTNELWEVNEAGDGLIRYTKGEMEESEMDIMEDQVVTFFDKQNDIYYYIFEDFIRQGAAENDTYKGSLTFKDGHVKKEMLAHKSEVYDENGNVTTMIDDFEGNELTPDEYDFIEYETYGTMEQIDAHIGWMYNEIISQIPTDELYEKLQESWNSFSFS